MRSNAWLASIQSASCRPFLLVDTFVKMLRQFIDTARSRGLAIALYKVWFVVQGFVFDFRRGTHTTLTSTIDEHGFPSGYGTGNFPCNARMLRKALVETRIQEGETFLDIGCGRGRAIIVAAEFPFSRLVGIDIVEQNVHDARQNLRRLGITNAEVRLADAKSDELQACDVWLFFRPFSPEQFVQTLQSAKQPPRVLILGNAAVGYISGYRRVHLQQHRVYPNFRYEVFERLART